MSPTENSWPWVIIFCIAAAVCAAIWYQKQQARWMAGVAVLLLLAVGARGLDWLVVTPRERLNASLREMVEGFRRGDVEETVSHISMQSPELRELARAAHQLIVVGEDLRLADVQIEMLAREQRALVRFRVNGTISVPSTGYSRHHATRWESRWHVEEDDWRMIEIMELDAISGQPTGLVDRMRIPGR